MNKNQSGTTRWRKALRFAVYFMFSLLVLAVLAIYALSIPAVQQRLTQKAESFLQEKLETRVEVGSIRLRFPYDISLENFLLEDQQGDTLIRVGSLVVSIGMWKLLDQAIEIKEISLENAGVYLQHKDSLYNFDFIMQAFAGSDTTTVADTTASSWKLHLDLAELQLKNVDFLLQDEDTESTTQARIGAAKTTIAKADLETLQFELDGFNLVDSDIRLVQKKKSIPGGKPSPSFGLLLTDGIITRSHLLYSTSEMSVDASLEQTVLNQLQLRSVSDVLAMEAQGVQVKNSTLAYRDPAAATTPGHLNAGDLDLRQLNADMPIFSFQNDTLFVQADALSGTDKSGLQLNALRAAIQVTPGSIAINKAVASLNQTSLDGDIFLFKNKGPDFDKMQIQLRQIQGVIGDLIVLLPPQENTILSQLSDMPYEVSGSLSGWLENLQTNNIRFGVGSGTIAHFNGSVQHLTDAAKLGMHLNISRLETNRSDLVRWMSLSTDGDLKPTPGSMDSLLNQPLPAWMRVAGNVNGNMSGMQLQLSGELGALQNGTEFPLPTGPPLQFDLAGSLTNANDPERLGMDLQINQLDAPKNFFTLLEQDGIQMPGLLSATGTLRGPLSALETDVQFIALRSGTKSHLAFKGLLKNLRTPDQLGFDVTLNGALARKEILGYLPDSVVTQVIRLPDFIQIDAQAQGNMKQAATKAVFGLGDLGQIYLDGTLRDSSYQMDVSARNLRVGQLTVDSALFPLKTLSLNAQIIGEGFQVGETARLQLTGKVDSLIWDNIILRDITFEGGATDKRFSGALRSTDDRAAVVARASIDFGAAKPLLETDITLNCLDVRAFGWSNRPTTVCMHIQSRSEGLSLDTMAANITIQNIDLQYDTVHVRPGDLALAIQLDRGNNKIQIESDWLQGEIKGHFVPADLSTTIANIAEQYFVVDRTGYVPRVGADSLSVELRLLRTDVFTTGLVPGLTELQPMYLEGSLVAPRNYFNLRIQAPRIVYLDWVIDSLYVRSYAGDTAALFVVTTPLVRRGNQDFIENAVLNGRFLANTADVSFKADSDDGRERFLLTLQALLNKNPKETLIKCSPRQVIDFKEWTVDAENQIRITPAGVDIRHFTMAGDGQSVQVEGATSKLKSGKTGLDFAVDIDRLNYNNFDIFLTGILLDLGGWADAHVTVKGSTDAPQVRGAMQFHETYFTPALTNVRYELSETPLEFTKSGIVLDGLGLTDPFGKILKINGTLATTDWINITSNLTLNADRWQVLNSTKQQNPVYYGELYATLNGSIRGPLSQPDIQLSVKTAKESSFTYVYDVATQQLQHEGVVYFLPPPRQYVRPPIYDAPVTAQPFTFSASIEIDSNLTINSVINPVTGDDFRGNAMGKLQFDMLSNGNMTLAGRAELVRGVYNYSYQSVVKRSFEVTTGSSITWTGDITTPELDLKARYQFKASPYPLVVNQLSSASPEEAAVYRKSQTFLLQTTLSGAATQPDVTFQFIYPSAEKQESLGAGFGNQQQGLVESALSNVNQDQNLLSRQVFGVLLLRNFIGESIGTTSIVGGGNPLQSGLSNFLTGQLNALADQYLNWIDVDLATTEGASNTGASQAEGTTNYQLRLQKSFFEDRLTFKLSGGTSVGGANGDDVHSALENASVEYALTPNGAFKVTVFSERGFELLNASSANLRNSGAGFILTKEFGKQ